MNDAVDECPMALIGSSELGLFLRKGTEIKSTTRDDCSGIRRKVQPIYAQREPNKISR